MEHYELIIFFFAISFIYASVGFGGGSSYLAILALYTLPFKEIRLVALICNIIVVTGGTIIYSRKKQVSWKKTLPLVLVSIPFAFLGATFKLKENIFFIILGCSLIIASVLLWINPNENIEEDEKQKGYLVNQGVIGGMIGLLSGVVGIGGGIFLSPLLNIIKWDTAKRIAATASVFILANSIAGIAGQLTNFTSEINSTRILFLSMAVLAGGQLGSRLSAIKFNHFIIRKMTSILVLAAGVEVLIKHI